jgi:hypothetical protein
LYCDRLYYCESSFSFTGKTNYFTRDVRLGDRRDNGKVPSGRIVNEIVAQLKQKPLVLAQDDCQTGDVFTLANLEGKQRKYNGCCCVAKALTDSTVTIDVHDATLSVKPENLNQIASSESI